MYKLQLSEWWFVYSVAVDVSEWSENFVEAKLGVDEGGKMGVDEGEKLAPTKEELVKGDQD